MSGFSQAKQAHIGANAHKNTNGLWPESRTDSGPFCPAFRKQSRNLLKDGVFGLTSNDSLGMGRLMWASSWNPEWGKRLRDERERLGLSLRDVETLSHSIAERRQSSDYQIARTSLADIENGKCAPSLHRLYTLSVIYGHDYDRLAIMCGVPAQRIPERAQNAVVATQLPDWAGARGLQVNDAIGGQNCERNCGRNERISCPR